MYNRYIPQSDGSYRRSRMPERPSSQSIPPNPAPVQEETYCPVPEPPCDSCCERPRPQRPPEQAGSFLKNLLPKGLNTEDLTVILLLLLMSGECREDRNLPLLTLALYLFL